MKLFHHVASKSSGFQTRMLGLIMVSFLLGTTFFSLSSAAPKAPWSATSSTNCPGQTEASDMTELDGTIYMLSGTSTFWSFDPVTETCTQLDNFPVDVSTNARLVALNSDTIYGTHNSVTYRYDVSEDRWIRMTRAILDDGTPVDNSGATQNNGNSIVAYNNELYILAGNGTTFESYDPVGNSWTSQASTPASVHDGAAMAVVGTDIYAFRGSNTTDFWEYNGTSWNSGIAQAPDNVEAGGALAAVGNTIYALRGNNSKDFWSYDTVGDSWNTTLPDTPDYVYGGGSLVTIGTDIYALQGNNAKNLWKYDTVGGSWDDSLTPFPAGIFGTYGGASLTTDGTDIYMFPGGNYQFFYKYTVGTDTWERLDDVPLVVGGDRTTAEGGLAFLNNVIYAVTGDGITGTGTTALGVIWRYPLTGVNANTWPIELHFPTPLTSTYGASVVHPGASAVDPTGDFFYLLRGNANDEFWKFTHAYESYIPFTRSFFDVGETGFISQSGSGSTITQGGGATFVVVSGEIYLVQGGGTNLFYKYTPSTNRWIRLSNIPDNIGNSSAMSASDNDTIWLVNSNDTFKYVISEDQWYAEANLGVDDNGNPYRTIGGADQSIGSRIVDDGAGGMFVAAGGGTVFIHWENDNNTWTHVTYMPSSCSTGCSMVRAGSNIYLMRGGSSKNLHVYDIDNNSWSQLTDIPSTANPEEGMSMAYPGSGDFIYMTVGNGSLEFYRYCFQNTGSGCTVDSYDQLANTPASITGGGALAALGNYVYALRGTNTTSFWRYDITQTPGVDAWNTGLDPADAPANVQAGGALVTDGTDIYATRGSGTAEFWRYDVTGDTWENNLDPHPEFVGTGNTTNTYGGLAYDPVSGDIYNVTGFGDNAPALPGETGPLYRYKLSAGAGQFTWPHTEGIPVNPGNTFRGAGFVYPGAGDFLYLSTAQNLWGFDLGIEEWYAFPKAILDNGESISQDGLDHEGRSTSIHYQNGKFYVVPGVGQNFQEYDPSSNEWKQLADFPLPPGVGFGVVESQMLENPTDSDKIFAFVDQGNTSLDDHWYSYDITDDEWTILSTSDLNPGCGNITYPGAGDWIYISNCWSPSPQYSNFRYSISKDYWVTHDTPRYDGYINGNPLTDPTPIADPTDTSLQQNSGGEEVIPVNGEIFMLANSNEMWSLDPSTNTWTQHTDTPEGQLVSAMVYPGGEKIYALFDRNTNFYEYCLPGSGGCTGGTWTLVTNTFPAGTGNDSGSFESTNWVDEADLFYPGSGDYIYATVGGVSNDVLQFCFQDTGSGCTVDTWAKIGEKLDADPNTSGYQYARSTDWATIDGNLVYVGTRGYEHVQTYNISTNTWGYTTDAPFTFGSASTLVSDGTYIWAAEGGNSKKMWRFDPGGSGWTDADFADLPGQYDDIGTTSGGWPTGGMTYDPTSGEIWLTTGVARGPDAAFSHTARGAFLWRYKIDPETCDGSGENPGTGSNPCNGYNEWPYYAAVRNNGYGQYRPTALEATGVDNYIYLLVGQYTRTFSRYTIEDKDGTPDRTAADPGPGTWTAMRAHPFPTNGPLMQYVSGYIYAARGYTSSNFTRFDFTETNPASLLGIEISDDNPATWATITDGTFTFTVDGSTYDIDGPLDLGIDFSGVTSMQDVASLLQTEIRNETSGNETVTYCDDLGSFNDRGYFLFRSGTAPGGGGSISYLGRITGVGTDISGVSSQGSPPVSIRANNGNGHIRSEVSSGGDWEYCGAAGQPENLPVRIGDSSAGSRSGGIEFVSGLNEIWIAHGNGDNGNSDSDDTGLLWRYKVSTNEWPHLPGLANPPGSIGGGGDLVAFDNDTLYALRGGDTDDFFEYDITANSWTNHSSVDPTPANVVAGGSLASDGTVVYATRGNGGGDFWTYDPAATAGSRWNNGGAPAQAPIKMGNTSSNDQTGQIRYDNNTIWAVTGSGQSGVSGGTALLNRYDVTGDEWPAIIDPQDPDAVATDWRGGSDLTSVSGTDIYGLRGYLNDTLDNFYHYDLLTDTWSQLASLPNPSPTLEISEGGNIEAVSTDTIYAFRGFGTDEFYRYDISGDFWESDPIQDFPTVVGTTNDNDDRGDLTYVSSQNSLYGIPGFGSTIYELDLDTRITVEQVNGGVNPEVNTPFDVIVQASDANGDPVNVGINTDVALTLETGNGNLGGTLTGTILNGNSQGTISGVTYDLPESGVSLRVTDTNPGVLLSSVSDAFTVDPATPNITSINPNTGTTMGGTEVVITGTNFADITEVTFDGIPATTVNFDNDTQLTVVTPPSNPSGTVGAVDVVLSNEPGPKTDTEVNGFTYAAPTITNVNPNTGATAGGNTTTITGTYFGPSLYTVPIDIDNSGGALTDYQVAFELDTATLISNGKMRSDCQDIRVYDTDQTTLLPYWVESGSCNTSGTRVWTKHDLAAGPSTKTIYVKYGNLFLTNDDDYDSYGPQIFDFFDDFTGSSVDTTLWTGDTGEFTVGNGVLEITGDNNDRLSSIQTFSGDQILEVKYIANSGPPNGFQPGGFFATTGNNIGYLHHGGGDYYRDDFSFIAIGSNVLQDGVDIITRYVASGSNVDISATNIDGTTTFHSASVANDISSENIALGERYDNGNYNQAYDTDWDWVFTRQYAATPPTVTEGSEVAQELELDFGTNAAISRTRNSETEISAIVPASTTGAGPVDVIVTNGDALTATEINGYTYASPTISNINPDNGPEAGGTAVVITGTNFTEGGYRRTITINNPTGGVLTDQAVPISLDTATLIGGGKMKSDCGDIRLKETDGETEIDYWIESCNTDHTIVWASIPSLPIAGQDIRMTYGNSSLTSLSNLSNVFPILATNNEFWIRANEGTDGVNDNDSVTTWNDQSGNGNDLTTNNTDPTFKTGIVNGLPVVRFNGSNNSMGRTGFTGLPTGSDVRTVFNLTSYSSAGYGGFAYGATTTDGVYGNVVGSNGNFYVQGWGSGNDFDTGTTANGTGFNIHTSVFAGNGANELEQFINGSSVSTHTTTAYNTGTTEIELGREMDNSPYINMDAAEILIFSDNLSTTDREAVEEYLNTKYNLYGSNVSATVGTEEGVGDNQINVTFDGIDATTVNFVNSTTINATTPPHAAGAVDVAVINPDSDTGTSIGGFTYNGAPTFTNINPDTGLNTDNALSVTVTGTNFLTGSTLTLQKTGQSDINCSSYNYAGIPTSFTCTLDLTTAGAVGAWDVLITLPDTQSVSDPGGFSITNPPPTVTNVNPDNGPEGGGQSVTITGTNFIEGVTSRPITIANTGAAQTDYQVMFELDTATIISGGGMQSDCDDIRVLDTDESTDIDFWVEPNTCNTAATKIWAEVPNVAASPANTIIYVTYGNNGLSSASSAANTFVREISSTLQGHWETDEATDGTCTGGLDMCDSSGNGFHGIIENGAPVVTDGKYGNARSYNGSNQYAREENISDSVSGGPVSWAAWVRPEDTGASDFVLSWHTNTGGNLIMTVWGSSANRFAIYDGNYNNATNTSTQDDWHFVVISADAATTANLYVDNNLETTEATGVRPAAGGRWSWAQEWDGASPSNFFNGDIDETMVFNHELTVAEIADLYNGKGYSTPNYANNMLVRKWSADGTNPEDEAISVSSVGAEVAGLRVTFDGVDATNVTFVNSTSITATTPAGTPGQVDVTVINPDTGFGTLNNGYTYIAAPNLTQINPNSGTNADSALNVTLTGTDFVSGATLTLERAGETDISCSNYNYGGIPTSFTCDLNLTGVAFSGIGTWDVTVENPDTQTDTLTDEFTISFVAPTITNVNPNEGPDTGGTNVTITGTNFVDSGGYIAPITISNGGSAETNYQVAFQLDTASLITGGKMNADCSDIRVLDSDGTTELTHWIDGPCNTDHTVVWALVPSVPSGDKEIYTTYGISNRTSASNLASTFPTLVDANNQVWLKANSFTPASSSAVTFAETTNVTPTGNTLEKVSGGNTWSGGASSNESITGDGMVRARSGTSTTYNMIGLDASPSPANGDYTQIDFALYANAGTLQVYESGTLRGSFGSHNVNDILSVEVKDNTVVYKKNGEEFYVSAVSPSSTLYFETAMWQVGTFLYDIEICSGSCEYASIDTWSDQSGNNNDATQSTVANMAGYAPNQLNGLPTLVFDGAEDLYGIADLSLFNNVGGASMFGVAKSDTTSSSVGVFFADTALVATRAGLVRENTVHQVGGRRLDADAYQGITGGTVSTTDYSFESGILDYANSDAFLYSNGSLLNSTTSFQTDGNTEASDSTAINIGGGPGGVTELNGNIAEIITFDKAVSTSEREEIERYLDNKYQITGNSPSTTLGTEESYITAVTFDGTQCTNSVYVNSTEMTCDTPAHAAGQVDVVVTNPDAQFDTLTNGFTYNLTAPGGVITDLDLWLRADTGTYSDSGCTTSATNGGNVLCWEDQSSNNFDVTNSTGPVLDNTESAATMNYNPFLSFSSNELFNTGDLIGPAGDTTIFGIGRNNTLSSSQALVAFGSQNPQLGTLSTDLDFTNFGSTTGGFALQTNVSYLMEWSWVELTDIIIGLNGDRNTIVKSVGSISPVLRIGADQGSVDFWDGDMAEILIYDRDLTAGERQQVGSYLALKYGISLDQTTPTDYLASDGATEMWDKDATGASTYNNDIAGIGQDNTSLLNQTESRSASPDSVVHISNPSDLENLEFMTWANDNGSTGSASGQVPSGVPVNAIARIPREWLVQNSLGDGVGTVSVAFDLDNQNSLTNSAVAGDYALLLDSDGDFSDATVYTTGATFNGNEITFTGVTLTDGIYFSLAGPATPAPGGISNNLTMWLKADNGVYQGPGATNPATTTGQNIAYWDDSSPSGNYQEQTTANNQPTYVSDGMNSNPTLDFEGGNNSSFFDYFQNSGVIIADLINGNTFHMFTVFDQDTILYNSATGSYGGDSIIVDTSNYFGINFTTNPSDLIKLYHWDVNEDTTSHSVTLNQPHLFSGEHGGGNISSALDGGTESSTPSGTIGVGSGTVRVGAGTNIGFDGEIGELIAYDFDLSALEQRKVESYLALKYGITIDQTTPTDYISTDENIEMWDKDATGASTYNNDIAGIGADGLSGLNQTQSRSGNADSILQISGASDLDNLEFMSWGNDDGSVTTESTELPGGLPGNATQRIAREWLIQNNHGDGVGTVTVTFDLEDQSAVANSGSSGDYALLIDTDGDFSDATVHTTGASFNNNEISFTTANLPDGSYISLAGPGTPTVDTIDLPASNSSTDLLLSYTTTPSNARGVVNWIKNQSSYLAVNMPFNGTGNEATTALDYSGNNNDGTVNGATHTSSGIVGGGYTFDGINDEISIADSATIDPTSNFTQVMWANVDTTKAGCFTRRVTTGNGNGYFFCHDQDDIGFEIWGDGCIDAYQFTNTLSNGWNQVAFTLGADGRSYEVFVNGVSVGTDTATNALNSIAEPLLIGTTTDNPLAGDCAPTGGHDYFEGTIDEFQMYNEVLSDQQISNLYDAGSPDNDTFKLMASEETLNGEDWQACVTPNAFSTDGIEVCSAEITITADNGPGNVVNDLQLWFKADAGVTNSGNGTDATAWADQSGSGLTLDHNTTPAIGGTFPTFYNSIINFHPILDFDQTTDRLGADSVANIPTGDFFLAAVYKRDDYTGAFYENVFSYGSSAETNEILLEPISDGSWDTVIHGTRTTSFDIGSDDGAAHIGTAARSTATINMRFDGDQVAVGSEGTAITPGGCIVIGEDQDSLCGGFQTDNAFEGDLAEIIAYSRNISATEVNKIESYLALKYGITLYQGDTPGGVAYVDSANSTIWAPDASDTFENDIAGIGQDDDSELDQTQSKSENTDAILRVADATSQDNLDFFTWSNNDGAATWTSTGAPSGYQILTRQWQGQEINDMGIIDLEFDVEDADFDVPALLGGTNYYFIADSDNDGDLSDETPAAMNDSGASGDDTGSDNLWTAQLDFNGGLDSKIDFTIASEDIVVPTVDTINLADANTNDDLALTFTTTPGTARGVVNWKEGGSSIALLNMPFEQTGSENTTAKDYSDNNNDGTVNSATFGAASGIIGGGYTFDGTDDYISVPSGSIGSLDVFTISAWAKVNSLPASQAYILVHDRQNADTAPNKHFEFRLANDGTLYSGWEASNGDDRAITYSDFWTDHGTNWVHLVMTRDSNGDGVLYVNGINQGTTSGSIETTNTDDIMIGAIRSTGSMGSEQLHFNGIIDEVRIYDRAISSEQVTQLYDSGAPDNDTDKTIANQETSVGEQWQACVTPNEIIDGLETCSNTITIADISAANSTFTASAASVVANGVTESILTATVLDDNTNPVTGEAVTVALTAGSGSPDIKAVNCAQADVGTVTKGTTNSSGQACFRVRSTDVTSPGNDTFTATITSIATAITQTADVEFTVDLPDIDDSTLGAAPGSVAADGATPSTITATIVDSLGRFIQSLTIDLSDDTGNPAYTPVSQSEATNASGVADFDVTNTNAETTTFTASFTSNHYDKTSYSETASPTFINDYEGTAATLVSGSQGNDVEATTTLPFDFELYGTEVTAGNNIYVCSNGFISLASSGCPSSGNLTNAIAGFYDDLDTSSGGIYREVAADNNSVRFLFDAEDVGTSNPVMFEIILTRSNRIELHYFVNSGLTARIGLYDGTASATPDEASAFDNSVFAATSASKFENDIVGTAVDLTQTTQVIFTAGTVVPGNSTVVAVPTAILADGVETSTITVTLRDGFNNPVPGRTVELSDDQTPGQVNYVGEATPPPYPNDVTDINGEVTFDVNSTSIDTATFTATDITSGSDVIGTADVDFTCILNANQQCVQIEIEPSPGVLTITAPDDFAFPATTADIQAQDIFSINSATPYTLNLNDVVVVTDTENNGGFNLQLQASAFEDAISLEQLPLTGLYAVTQASSTGGIQSNGVEYDAGYGGVQGIDAPQNNATAGSLTDPATFTTNGDNLDTVIDLMNGDVTVAQIGRDGQFKQNIQYYLQIPGFIPAGNYQVTLTYDLTRTAPI